MVLAVGKERDVLVEKVGGLKEQLGVEGERLQELEKSSRVELERARAVAEEEHRAYVSQEHQRALAEEAKMQELIAELGQAESACDKLQKEAEQLRVRGQTLERQGQEQEAALLTTQERTRGELAAKAEEVILRL